MAREVTPEFNEEELKLMEVLLAEGHIKHKYAVRLQTVINRAKGLSTNNVALFLGININTVSSHVHRFNEGGIEALLRDKTRKPGTAPISVKVQNKLVQFVCQEKPKYEAHWSTRELSKRFKISHTMVI
jgi:transposase